MADKKKFEDDITSHDFDGIKELDNKAPAWLILIFYVTIGFSMLYLVHYFGYPGNGNDQASEYDSTNVEFEQQLAELKAAKGEVVKLSSEQMIAKGKVIYSETGCTGCHGSLGEGASAPNLSDNFWIHGCATEEVSKLITEGSVMKGMPSYKSTLSEEQITYVTEYILKEVVGSNPANASAAKGEECK